MIISKTPVRISIGGGGTDLPSFYSKFGSYFISAAIDKYVYIIVQERRWYDEFLIKYSKTESVRNVNDIKNEIIRECLKYLKITTPIEIVSISDVGGLSGLGSSGAFTVGLLNALHAFKREAVSQCQLAEEACHITIDILKKPSGKQDEYIAAYGGFTSFKINTEGDVQVARESDEDFVRELEHYLYMFHTGLFRNSVDALSIQDKSTRNDDAKMIANLRATQRLGYKIKDAMNSRNLHDYGKLLHMHWLNKRKRAKTTNPQIDRWYRIARQNGAMGGKIMGAGGGGFFLFYCPNESWKLINSLKKVGLRHVPFNFDYSGTKVVADF